jgi:hypothetical protein
MPPKLNIGLSQKIAEASGGAREASLHLELEIEPGLLAEPPRLHKRIRQLFSLLRLPWSRSWAAPAAARAASGPTSRPFRRPCRNPSSADRRAGCGPPPRPS